MCRSSRSPSNRSPELPSAESSRLEPIVVARARDAWFASDLHLDDDQPGLTARFLGALRTLTTAGRAAADGGGASAAGGPLQPPATAAPTSTPEGPALFLLGDLFEYWIGDDHPSQVAATLAAELSGAVQRGWRVFLMRGNRDFLIGEDYARRCSATLLDEPALTEIGGERIVLVHGDAECLDDTGYQQWRQLSHTPAWQQQFLSRSIDERLAMARAARAASLAHRKTQVALTSSAPSSPSKPTPSSTTAPEPTAGDRPDPPGDAADRVEGGGDLSTPAVTALLEQFGAIGLIHGHTHRPARHALDGGRWRWVLSDWEVTPPRGELQSLDDLQTRLTPRSPS